MKRKQSSLESSSEELTAILIATWRKILKLPIGPLDRLQTREFRALVASIEKLKKEKDFSEASAIGAYLLYDWQLHHAQGLSLLQELPSPPARVLDLACGGAPFALAALKHGAHEAVGLDTNPRLLKIATDVCGKSGYTLALREHDCQNLEFPIQGKWDLIILGYALFELSKEPLAYIENLMSQLSDEGYILIVEPSLQQENRRLLALRDKINARGIPIQAPCLWKGACPAFKHPTSTCFAQRTYDKPYLVKEIQRALKVNLNSLKMSYLILRKTARPDLTRSLYRVVSPPINTFRGPRFFLCGNQGQKTLGSSLDKHPKHSRAYEYLNRGDIISIENAIERENDLEVYTETSVKLEAPCDKPAPSV